MLRDYFLEQVSWGYPYHPPQLHLLLRFGGLLAGNHSHMLQGDADLNQNHKGKYRKILMISAWGKFDH